MSEENLIEELDNAFITPDRFFKDEKLAPYTEGSRLLMLQVRDENDSAIYFLQVFRHHCGSRGTCPIFHRNPQRRACGN